ncbi:MAG: hypothetical protein M3Q27_12850 [Actinomycetota bacterium]|nr:hypothetical protein [Actinomycetota bacterium]
MTMIVCMETSAASWLLDSQVPWQQLVNLGPAGFPAYARLRFLPDPRWPGQKEAEAVARPDTPSEGDQLRAALAVLSRHTSTPKQCYFCLWDGYGLHAPSHVVDGRQPSRQQAEVEPLPREAHSSVAPETAQPGLRPLSMQPERPTHSAATVRIPHRDYYLFQGAWSDLGDWGALQDPSGPHDWVPPPAFVWPADHAWCLAHDVDPHYAGIGANPVAIQALLDDPRLDVVEADPSREPPRYA